MIAYSYIERNIQLLWKNYLQSKSIADKNFNSKMAILELCGWIEVSMDDAIIRTGTRVLKSPDSLKFIREKVKRNYGFEYDKHFKSMIVYLVGISGFETIDISIDLAIKIKFQSELIALKERRNSLAHTYTKGTTQHYDTPSITLERLANVSAGLKAYDAALREIG